jgi:hypothetical protein
MRSERLGLGADGRCEQERRGEGLGARGEENVARRADWRQKSALARGAGCSGPEQLTLGEQPTLAERPRRWGWGLTGEERVIRDMMIYHAVEIRRSPQRRVARIWKLTPARVSQIAKQFGRDLRDSPTLRETIDQYALEWFSDVGN